MISYKYLFPFESVPRGSRILLYGTGNFSYQYCKQLLMTNYCEVAGFISPDARDMTGGIRPVYSFSDLPGIQFDHVVIAEENKYLYQSIFAALQTAGVSPEKIIARGFRLDYPCDPPITIGISGGEADWGLSGNAGKDDFSAMIRAYPIHDIKTVSFMGGLGNQLYQYIFSRYIECMTDKQVFLDDIYFYTINKETVHNGLVEMENVFPVKLNRLSAFFSDIWEKIIDQYRSGSPVWYQIVNAGVRLDILSELHDNAIEYGSGRLIPFYSRVWRNVIQSLGNDNLYFLGYWQLECTDILKDPSFRQTILDELQFPAFTSQMNRIYAQRMVREKSAAVHIRRGDFVSLGVDTQPEYYKQCILLLERRETPDHYYVFSDDPAYCQENAASYGFDMIRDKMTFVVENKGKAAYNDLHLMTLSKYLIPSPGSSFSRMAKSLAKRDMIVVSSQAELDVWYS